MARGICLRLVLVSTAYAGACGGLVPPPQEPADSSLLLPEQRIWTAPIGSRGYPLPVESEPQDPPLSPELFASLDLAPTVDEGSGISLYDPNSGRWLVVDMNFPMGKDPYASWIGVVSAEDEEELTSGPVEAQEIPQHLPALGVYSLTPNAIDEVSSMAWATGGRIPLVRVGAAILHVTQVVDEWVIRMYDAGGSFSRTLAVRPAEMGRLSLTECETGPDEICGRMMPATLTLGAVRVASDGRTALLQGWFGPESHERAGPFHWVVPLPDEVSLVLQAEPVMFEFNVGTGF